MLPSIEGITIGISRILRSGWCQSGLPTIGIFRYFLVASAINLAMLTANGSGNAQILQTPVSPPYSRIGQKIDPTTNLIITTHIIPIKTHPNQNLTPGDALVHFSLFHTTERNNLILFIFFYLYRLEPRTTTTQNVYLSWLYERYIQTPCRLPSAS